MHLSKVFSLGSLLSWPGGSVVFMNWDIIWPAGVKLAAQATMRWPGRGVLASVIDKQYRCSINARSTKELYQSTSKCRYVSSSWLTWYYYYWNDKNDIWALIDLGLNSRLDFFNYYWPFWPKWLGASHSPNTHYQEVVIIIYRSRFDMIPTYL